MDIKIKQFVYRVRARLREQKMIEQLLKLTAIGLSAAVLISLISLVLPFYHAVPVAVGAVTVSFLLGVAGGIKATPSLMEAALTADSKGHKERISTAFYLTGKEDAFSTLQKKDALRIVNSFEIRKEFPIRLQWKSVLTVIGLAIIFTISSLIDTPARDLARTKHEVRKEAKEEIAKLEKVEKAIRENKEISEAESKEINEQLENAKKELAEVDSFEDLKKAEERITKKMEMASVKTENKTLSETLAEAAEEAKEDSAEEKKELAEEVKEALDKAKNGSTKDKKEAYEQLKKLAELSGDGDLQTVAENYAASDYSDMNLAKAERALNNAIANLSENHSEFAENNQNNGQSSENQNNQNGGQQGNQQAGSRSGQNSQNGQNGQNGQGEQNGQGNGNGSGNGDGQGGSGSGAGWNRGSKDGQERGGKTNENITVPDGTVGDDDNLTGKANGNENSSKSKSGQSKTWSGNKVSYDKVSGKYKDKAYKKVDGSNYPGKMKDRIKHYFDGLN